MAMSGFRNYSRLRICICRQNVQLSDKTVSRLCARFYINVTAPGSHASDIKLTSSAVNPCAKTSITQTVVRFKSDSGQQDKRERSVVETDPENRPFSELSTAQKVGRVGKDSVLGLWIILGLGATGSLFYFVYRELFSRESPYGIYEEAMDICLKDTRVQDALGKPLKAHGETSGRGRRRHIRHTIYEFQGYQHMRLQFYLKGKRERATAHVEVRKNDNNKYEYRYLFVETEGFPRRVITLKDNRAQLQTGGTAGTVGMSM
ncbi:mitochondrial import inner membrane translocase subunit Tim21 [Lingula anatina]|uniref:Mitochondrial import inner membrane translocase subunit Tim21 n=1 Tax=Lingula anatina TaxID=7574 RepID=A0A1S3H9J4_LINAN|nr:mitochondrial import inner membrane translocase subunit Tim21 [Lingula anatina]|eukprot:XP_013382678.1 mitochondrial import inner membrane translocase subunit Tim21 [Lingula anatina]